MSERDRAAGIRLTARGAVASVLVFTLLGSLLHALFGLPAAVGLAFLGGCAVAVALVNPRDLLSLVVSPPLVFLLAALISEAVRSLTAPSPSRLSASACSPRCPAGPRGCSSARRWSCSSPGGAGWPGASATCARRSAPPPPTSRARGRRRRQGLRARA
nr:hypothetical protein GCM10020093_061220 [Planobispora longispora]